MQYVYEPGSTFKIVAYSAALEEGEATPDDPIDCQMGSITLLGRTVRDTHAYGTLTVAEALAKSSNVAAIKLGRKVGDGAVRYIRVRLLERTGVGGGETRGLLRTVQLGEYRHVVRNRSGYRGDPCNSPPPRTMRTGGEDRAAPVRVRDERGQLASTGRSAGSGADTARASADLAA